ncbi:MAG: acyl-CoA thioesterase [Bacteroides sp.]|nr:acyl-CoA thioesterase [Bacteroides sp.]MDE6076573.1 acyl-CoA thioesterase [Muribaculaceae bacterium]MDE6422917.1 acyl-CoA thioesterase [Muribaculaceae bacterium]
MDPNNLPDISLFRSVTPVQIRFNDVDVLGHVNNTVYFSYYDTGKARYFEAVQGKKVEWKHVDTVIANVNCAYMAPIYFEEDIEVLTACTAVYDKSFRLLQAIREKRTGQIKSMCETIMVSFDPSTGHSRPLPEEWRKMLDDYEGHSLKKAKE